MNIFALDRNLTKHREGDVVLGRAECFDLCIGTWLLAAKVVCGEAENNETFVLVSLVNLLKSFVLWRKTALAGDVNDENNFAFELLEARRLAIDVWHGEIVERVRSDRGHGKQGIDCGSGDHG